MRRTIWVGKAVTALLVAGSVCGCGGQASGDAGIDVFELVYVEDTGDVGVLDVARDVPADRVVEVPVTEDALDVPDAADVPLVPCGATDEACPEGSTCRTVHNGTGDLRMCVPGPDLLCAPCNLSTDCQPPGVSTADRCLDDGAAGKFCAIDCSIGNGCPEGYDCVTPADAPHTVLQCVPAAGAECACPPAAVERGLATVCTRTNTFGTCKGQRRCTAEGLTACDAIDAAEETCNGIDDNCDGSTDEGIVFGTCALQWGKVMCVGPRVCVDGVPTCKAGPPTAEICDGIDNDCDGETDEDGTADCTNVWIDRDGDGHGVGEPRCGCAFNPPWTATVGDDCNDDDPAIHPGATEICDGKDNDCDGRTDPPGLADCTLAYVDADKDGYGDPATVRCLCGVDTANLVPDGTDCNDGDPAIHPGAAEVCNGADDDCDGLTDDGPDRGGCQVYHADADLDGWGSVVDGPCLCHPDGGWVTTKGGDCADDDPARNPSVAELCNHIDDDCDGLTDEDFNCDPTTIGTEPCGFCGSRQRTCGADCMWPADWSECAGSKTCQPGTLLTCETGCGNHVCTDGCEWPTECTWTLDAYEPNESQFAARSFGYFEEPNAPPPVSGWIHGPDDVDWYGFIADEAFPIFIDVVLTLYGSVRLTGGSGTHHLCIYWDNNADGVIDETHCVDGVGDLFVETSNVDPGPLDEAYGMIYVSVSGDPSCTPYTLSFTWDS